MYYSVGLYDLLKGPKVYYVFLFSNLLPNERKNKASKSAEQFERSVYRL